MTKKFRGTAAALAAGALTLTMAPSALAAPDNSDADFKPNVATPGLHRIADKDRISTAVKASQSRTWGVVKKVAPGSLYWECTIPGDAWGLVARSRIQGTAVPANTQAGATKVVEYTAWPGERAETRRFTCTATVATKEIVRRDVHVIVARSDDFPDAIAASPLADVLNAPVLINPTAKLDARVKEEIARLKATATGGGEVYVHLLGGTNALSHGVEKAIDGVLGDKEHTLRYQGIDRYQTAVAISSVALTVYGIDSGAGVQDANVYLTTGLDFADALAGGAAAANNDGVVLLTAGEKLDRRGFTEKYLMSLRTWVNDGLTRNTTETIAVGGPSARAAAKLDIRLAKEYVGKDRFDTAAKTAKGEFSMKKSATHTQNFAVVSGVTYADALVASGYIANADGPLLLTHPGKLSAVTGKYLGSVADSHDRVFTFGGPGAMDNAVHAAINDLLNF